MGIVKQTNTVNSKNLYATLGYNFRHNDLQAIKKTACHLAEKALKSKNCSETRAVAIFNQLRIANNTLEDDFRRSDYEIQYKEHHLTQPLKPRRCFDKMSVERLQKYRTRFEGYLAGHKREIATIKEQHAIAIKFGKGYGTLPEQYQHLDTQFPREEDSVMTGTSVAELRAKLLVEYRRKKSISKLMIKDLKKRLRKSTTQACELCDTIHKLNARIKQLS